MGRLKKKKKKKKKIAELFGNFHVSMLCRHFGAFIVKIVEMRDYGNVALEKIYIFSVYIFYSICGAYSKGAF